MVGDRLVVGVPGTTLDAATRRALRDGSVAGILLLSHNVRSFRQLQALSLEARLAARAGGHPPPLVCIDQEGGRVDRLRRIAPRQPSAARLARRGPGAVQRSARGVGALLQRAGVNVNFAPSADLARGAGIIGDRSYGSDPVVVGACVAAAVRGYQEAGVQAVVKHYPGHGLTSRDSHERLPVVQASPSKLARHEGVFSRAMASAPAGVMLGHFVVTSVDPKRPASLSGPFVRRLKRSVGARPLVFTDSGAMGALDGFGDEADRAGLALAAGVDVYLTTTPLARLPARFHERVALRLRRQPLGEDPGLRVREWRRSRLR